MKLETVTVRLEIDRASLNNYLGNTPNVTIEAAVSELLNNLLSDAFPYYCDRCGTAHLEATGIKGRFAIMEGGQ